MAARAKGGVVSYQKPVSLPSSVVRLRLLRTEPLQCVQSLHRSDLAVHIHQSLVHMSGDEPRGQVCPTASRGAG